MRDMAIAKGPEAAGALRHDTAGEKGLPRYFARCFGVARAIRAGRLDITLPDGRVFRAEGAAPGIEARLDIHDPEVFARLVREGYLGFCEAYLDGGWSTPDLQAFLDLLNDDNEAIYNGYPGQRLAQLYERICASGSSATPRSRRGATSNITTISATSSTGSGSMTR